MELTVRFSQLEYLHHTMRQQENFDEHPTTLQV